MIKARMRAGATWGDALILNLSSRGMLVRADQPLGRGSYLEIRLGSHVIVVWVVWSRSGRLGVQTQDLVPADSLMSDPSGTAAPRAPGHASGQERRAAPRSTALRHESNRQKARVAEFAVIAAVCGIAALLIAIAGIEIVAKPLAEAQAALAEK